MSYAPLKYKPKEVKSLKMAPGDILIMDRDVIREMPADMGVPASIISFGLLSGCARNGALVASVVANFLEDIEGSEDLFSSRNTTALRLLGFDADPVPEKEDPFGDVCDACQRATDRPTPEPAHKKRRTGE